MIKTQGLRGGYPPPPPPPPPLRGAAGAQARPPLQTLRGGVRFTRGLFFFFFIMANDNTKLNKVKQEPQDEYYTPLWAIEKELRHYDFTNKVVYLNCDNPKISMFIKYFKDNFKLLGLQKLYYTFLDPENAHKGTIMLHNDNVVTLETPLKGNGSFDSQECIEVMKVSDIIVTNPPFSLLRKLLGILEGYNKQYILLAPQHCVDYVSVFDLFKEYKLFFGANIENIDFYNPILNITKKIGSMWLQNIKLIRNKNYEYRYDTLKQTPHMRLDNGNIAINSYRDIPKHYNGVILAPITILHNWDYDKFKALWVSSDSFHKGERLFKRIAIIHRDSPELGKIHQPFKLF